ncbi:MAG: Holliday junction branch migration protein RuvA [Bacteroidetes bacterium]|nr:Holliday junction branch migration protein RuvA [Bacteroidota bacterium]
MIAYIQGKLVEKNPTYAILESNGIAYMLNISLNTFTKIKDEENCKLFTHLAIKSEATTPVGFVLYGFASDEERRFFRHLISVSGVGSNTARLILSSLTTAEIQTAIQTNNVGVFQKVKGIGEKSAQRIIIDLKGKIEKEDVSSEKISPQYNTLKEEALTALIMLGFNRNIAEKAVDKTIKNEGLAISVEELIKYALKVL